MKRICMTASVFVGLFTPAVAGANVKQVELFSGRLSSPESCFVQIDLEEVEQNMFNGAEKLVAGDTTLFTFKPLQDAGKNVAAGKSVLAGSAKFGTEAGIQPDITLTDQTCASITGGAKLEFHGSFGAVAAILDLPADYAELDVVGILLRRHLETEKYQLKSLSGEKEIGGTAPTSNGSSGSTSGSAPGNGSSGSTPTSPASSSDDSSCALTHRPSCAHGGLAAGLLGLCALARRRRARARARQ